MDIFSFFKKKSGSKDTAKDRLKLILMHDRGDVSPELLENIKNDILEVLRKYVEIDIDQELDLQITQTDSEFGSVPALVANIPIRKKK
ncbi:MULTISPECIES: cell division topological specificity factor MinE [Proteiniclasticum]|jgi:cell division topological specificity factor|uniref:Cell division topological specificity factor n=1 Tax=Proteiniclasticum ruminis TaxID=398199 RepID=A0A1G8NGK1_9CLOT|nr:MULTISPECIES: cell division topological specificity factor MinE [Proteiniclasticum]MBP9921478.1 cell division topological specificity factor MinE [Proteiniclasticum sp.]SDI79288.1 cell division topological specificity factor [Proteiniclasticum ruminis]SFN29985.1 cell division topological specificity factor MinE [Proteiniclasticum ruminis]